VDVEELWNEMSKLIDEQQQKFKLETEQQIRQLFRTRTVTFSQQ